MKYIRNGSDRALFKVDDEIVPYVQYVGCSQDILGFHLHEQNSRVEQLDWRLPQKQHMYFEEDITIKVAGKPQSSVDSCCSPMEMRKCD